MRPIEKQLDILWSKLVKLRDNGRCVICNSDYNVQAHHYYPRKIKILRWELKNGFSLCQMHHNMAHNDFKKFTKLLDNIVNWEWLMSNRHIKVYSLYELECLKTKLNSLLNEVEDIKHRLNKQC